jgi:single-strand DNA-binding protein
VFNLVILIGRLTRDPEMRYTPSGQAVTRFTLAVDRPVARGPNGEKQTDFVDVVVWRKLAEQASQFLTKGRLVCVRGRLQIRSYDDSRGVRRKASEIVAYEVRFLDGRRQDGAAAAADAGSDDIPLPPEPEPAGIEAGGEDEMPF